MVRYEPAREWLPRDSHCNEYADLRGYLIQAALGNFTGSKRSDCRSTLVFQSRYSSLLPACPSAKNSTSGESHATPIFTYLLNWVSLTPPVRVGRSIRTKSRFC